jgi:hypothetical protein
MKGPNAVAGFADRTSGLFGGMMPLLRGRASKVVIFQCLLALSQPG